MKKRSKVKKAESREKDGSLGEIPGVIVGMINDDARDLIPSIGDSETSKLHVVDRKYPNTNLSFSINCEEGEDVLGEVSIGDSEIRVGNERNLVEHEIYVAKRVWSFAKDNLGVTGRSKDEVYSEKNWSLEARDQNAKAKKGKKKMSQ